MAPRERAEFDLVSLLLDGSTSWPPLAIAIAGGVAGATILALQFLPGAYRPA